MYRALDMPTARRDDRLWYGSNSGVDTDLAIAGKPGADGRDPPRGAAPPGLAVCFVLDRRDADLTGDGIASRPVLRPDCAPIAP